MTENKVYSTQAKEQAKEAVNKHIKEIDHLLMNLITEMGKYKSLKRAHYGYVGDLAYVEELLVQVWEFLAETDS